VIEEEPRGVAGRQLLLAQSAGGIVIAVRLRALPGALRTCRIGDVVCQITYALICMSLMMAAIIS
jgi:hypothetical protein